MEVKSKKNQSIRIQLETYLIFYLYPGFSVSVLALCTLCYYVHNGATPSTPSSLSGQVKKNWQYINQMSPFFKMKNLLALFTIHISLMRSVLVIVTLLLLLNINLLYCCPMFINYSFDYINKNNIIHLKLRLLNGMFASIYAHTSFLSSSALALFSIRYS